MRYSVLFQDETRISGEASNFQDIEIIVNCLSSFYPAKCVTVFFDEERSVRYETENEEV